MEKLLRPRKIPMESKKLLRSRKIPMESKTRLNPSSLRLRRRPSLLRLMRPSSLRLRHPSLRLIESPKHLMTSQRPSQTPPRRAASNACSRRWKERLR